MWLRSPRGDESVSQDTGVEAPSRTQGTRWRSSLCGPVPTTARRAGPHALLLLCKVGPVLYGQKIKTKLPSPRKNFKALWMKVLEHPQGGGGFRCSEAHCAQSSPRQPGRSRVTRALAASAEALTHRGGGNRWFSAGPAREPWMKP